MLVCEPGTVPRTARWTFASGHHRLKIRDAGRRHARNWPTHRVSACRECLNGFAESAVPPRRRSRLISFETCKASIKDDSGDKLAADLQERFEILEPEGEPDSPGPYDQVEAAEESAGVRMALSLLRFYKSTISPLLPPSCRYLPTCSEYAMEAYKKFGCVKGTILTAWRLARCNPFGSKGYDPVRWPPPGLEWVLK